MNAGMQCLINTEDFVKYFLSKAYKKEINYDNPLGTKGQLVNAFADLLTEMWNGNSKSV